MDKVQREPLLYIHQPAFKVPEVKMQGSFSSKKARKTKSQDIAKEILVAAPKDSKEAIKVEGAKQETTTKEVQEVLQRYDEEKGQGKGRASSLRRLKSFKEMNLLERLDYLNNFPKHIPPIPCIFQTENSSVRGVLVSKTEDEVIVKQFDRSEKSIPIRELKAVSMMGLN